MFRRFQGWGLGLLLALLPLHPSYSQDNSNSRFLGQENRQVLNLSYQRQDLGQIIAYTRRGSILLPLGEVAEQLGFPIFVNPKTGVAQGWFITPEKTFLLDTQEQTVAVGGKNELYDDALIIPADKDIYIDSSLLSNYLHLTFLIDYNTSTVKIKLPHQMDDADKKKFKASVGKKQEEVMREEHTASQETGEEENLETVTPNEKIATTPVAVTGDSFSDDNLLVLQATVDGYLQPDFLDGYGIGDRYFLPLEPLVTLLDFPITVDTEKGIASGWFMDSKRTFTLNTKENTVRIKGKKATLAPNTVFVTDYDIYVDTAVLEQWFPVSFSIDTRKMVLNIKGLETLPFHLKQARQKQLEVIERQKAAAAKAKEYTLVSEPYKLYSTPFMDFSINHNYRNHAGTKHSTQYSVQAGGDLGELTTETFASGSTDNSLIDTLRIKGQRVDETGHLLGPLHAKSFSIGDIDSETVPLVAQTSLGRGVAVSSRSPLQASQFDVTTFTGNALPGWEIELYRNDALIDFQQVDSDGRYSFIDVPVLFGSNTFRLVFYGPQGQIEEEVKQLYIADSALEKGEFVYDMSLDEKSQDLFGISEKTGRNKDGVRGIGRVEYGVTNNISVSAGGVQTPLEDGNHTYMTSGIKTSFGGFFVGADGAYDIAESGWAGKLTALTSIHDTSIKLEQKYFDNFFSEEESPLDIPRKSVSEADINSFETLPLIHDISIGLNAKYEEFVNGIEETTISNRLSKSLFGINVSHELGVVNGAQDRLQGSLAVRGYFWRTLIGTQADYRISPDKNLDRVNVTLQRNLTEKVNVRLGYTKNLGTDKRAVTDGSLNWDFGTYRLSTQMNVDDDNSVFVGLGLNVSLGKIPGRNKWLVQSAPMSYGGGVVAHAFVDNNYNNIYDEGDQTIDKARFKVGNRAVKAEKGYGIGTQLQPYQKTNVTLDTDTLEDPLWIPGIEGYSIEARPGVMAPLEFPVLNTNQIDGTLYLVREDGTAKPLKNITVQLVAQDGKVVSATKTEYDGFYILEKILPGEYQLTIAPKDLKRIKAQLPSPESISITPGGDYYSGYDIKLAPNDTER